MAAVARRLKIFVARRVKSCSRLYSDGAPSRGPDYTTDLAEATVSLSSRRPLPVYRVMNAAGNVLVAQQDPNVQPL